jgi:hypothetical protein
MYVLQKWNREMLQHSANKINLRSNRIIMARVYFSAPYYTWIPVTKQNRCLDSIGLTVGKKFGLIRFQVIIYIGIAAKLLTCTQKLFVFSHFLGVFWNGVDWVHLVRRSLISLLYKPQMMDDGDCGAIGGTKIGMENRTTWRKSAPVPLCPPQIPYDLTRAQTRAAAVGKPGDYVPEIWRGQSRLHYCVS